MDIQLIFVDAFITIFSLGLFIVSILSFKKFKNIKLLFVSIVFLVFLIKGLIMSYSLFNTGLGNLNSSFYFGIFDLLILVLLFVATLKR